VDTDGWFDHIIDDDFERDWAEEAYWRDACPECESHHPRNEPCDRELESSFRYWVELILGAFLVGGVVVGYTLLVLHFGPMVIGRG